jgi:hypothetical protein
LQDLIGNQDEGNLHPFGSTKQYFLDNVGARIGINPDLHNPLFLSGAF